MKGKNSSNSPIKISWKVERMSRHSQEQVDISSSSSSSSEDEEYDDEEYSDDDDDEEEQEMKMKMKIFYKFLQKKKCVVCGTVYEDRENIGQLKCSYHPGPDLPLSRGRRIWRCCNRIHESEEDAKTDRGCCKCDHRSKEESCDTREHMWKISMFDKGSGVIKYPVEESRMRKVIYENNREDGTTYLDPEGSIIVFKRFTNIPVDDKE